MYQKIVRMIPKVLKKSKHDSFLFDRFWWSKNVRKLIQNTPSEAKLDLFSNTSARLKEADPQGLMSKEGAQGPGSGMLNMALFQGETATQKEDIFKVKVLVWFSCHCSMTCIYAYYLKLC